MTTRQNRSKGLYRRGNIWWIAYKDADGKVQRETSGSTLHKEAQLLLNRRRYEAQEGKKTKKRLQDDATFADLIPEYDRYCRNQAAYKSKQSHLKQLKERFGNLRLRDLNLRHIEQLQLEEQEAGKKPATINRLTATLKHMCTKAADWEMIDQNTLATIRKARMLKEKNQRDRFLTTEECGQLLANCAPHLLPIVTIALNTGMRKGEILNLKWKNVDLKNRLILLEQTQTKNAERREIPINETLLEMLTKLPRRLDVPHVFYDPKTGRPYQDVKLSFRTALRKAKIKDFRFHDLRHTFASHLVMAGVDLTTVKELLGHKSIEMTLRYAHLAPSHKRYAVEALDSVFSVKERASTAYG